jgi:ribonuclease HI
MNTKTSKTPRKSYYVVREGRNPGIYHTWEECKLQVDGFKGPVYKKFNNYEDAYNFFRGYQNQQGLLGHTNYGDVNAVNSESVEIYTDGACCNNGYSNAQAGIGVFFGDADPRNISEALPRNLIEEGHYPTNQLAELYAIARAMEVCIADHSIRTKPIILHTDSKYSINCLTRWITTWEKNCWFLTNGKPVKHQALLRAMKLQTQNLNIIFRHVAGHRGIHGNERADSLAVEGASMYVPDSHTGPSQSR